MTKDTPAARLLASVADLEQVKDPGLRAEHGHALQEAIKQVTPRLRTVVDGAVLEQREAGVPLAPIAKRLGVSVQRVSQMASSNYAAKRQPPPLIYAARIVDEDDNTVPGEDWHGEPDALAKGGYETGYIDFQPAVSANRFAGRRLEVRYGPVPDDGMLPAMHAYTTVNGRRLRPTAVLHELLFTAERTA